MSMAIMNEHEGMKSPTQERSPPMEHMATLQDAGR